MKKELLPGIKLTGKEHAAFNRIIALARTNEEILAFNLMFVFASEEEQDKRIEELRRADRANFSVQHLYYESGAYKFDRENPEISFYGLCQRAADLLAEKKIFARFPVSTLEEATAYRCRKDKGTIYMLNRYIKEITARESKAGDEVLKINGDELRKFDEIARARGLSREDLIVLAMREILNSPAPMFINATVYSASYPFIDSYIQTEQIIYAQFVAEHGEAIIKQLNRWPTGTLFKSRELAIAIALVADSGILKRITHFMKYLAGKDLLIHCSGGMGAAHTFRTWGKIKEGTA